MLDEPSLGLAPLLIDEVFAWLRELHAAGTTILLVEQNAARTIEAADRTYVPEQGEDRRRGPGLGATAETNLLRRILASSRTSKSDTRPTLRTRLRSARVACTVSPRWGIALIFVVMRLINFAQTALITLGGYTVLLLGSPSWLSPSLVTVTVISTALPSRLSGSHFDRCATPDMATLLVTSFAVSSFLQNVLIMIAGAQTQGRRLRRQPAAELQRSRRKRLSRFDIVTIV